MTDPSDLLFDFSDPAAAESFRAVDDRVMGGVSQSSLLSAGDYARFEGDLSTERNGGFASVRSNPAPVDLSRLGGIALRVRGDGRTYQLRMRTDARWDGVSYRTSFTPPPDEWTTIQLPFESFEPTFRGRVPANTASFDPAAVQSFGLMVADKQVGRFRLEISWISTFAAR